MQRIVELSQTREEVASDEKRRKRSNRGHRGRSTEVTEKRWQRRGGREEVAEKRWQRRGDREEVRRTTVGDLAYHESTQRRGEDRMGRRVRAI